MNQGIVINVYEEKDVGDLYRLMGDSPTKDQILEIKNIGIKIGHSGVLDRACELLGVEPTREDLSEALHNAVGIRGYSIEEDSTSVGSLYQRLFKPDFKKMILRIPNEKGEVLELPYDPSFNKLILASKGYRPRKTV